MSETLQLVKDKWSDYQVQLSQAFLRNYYKNTDWKEIYEKVKRRDDVMMRDYDSEIDTLLVFAGLYSAVLTAFIVDVYQNLNVDYAQDSAAILRQMLAQAAGQTVDLNVLSPPAASPSTTVIIVLVLWFISLVLSLLSALFSIFVKQWLHTYAKWMDVAHNNLKQGLVLRAFYQDNFNSWGIPAIFAALGVLLQIALVLFVIGLVAYLWTLERMVSAVLSFFALVMIVLSALVLVLPIFYENCPYKFLLVYVLFKSRILSSERDWTKRDVPIAEKHLHLDDTPLRSAIAETALLLDVAPGQLASAISAISKLHPTPNDAAVAALVRDRVHELSAESTVLLSSIVTSDAILESDFDKGDSRLLSDLWQITLGNMTCTPLTILLAIYYLRDRIKSQQSSDLGQEYAVLLVTCLLPKLSETLLSHDAFAMRLTELSRLAASTSSRGGGRSGVSNEAQVSRDAFEKQLSKLSRLADRHADIISSRRRSRTEVEDAPSAGQIFKETLAIEISLIALAVHAWALEVGGEGAVGVTREGAREGAMSPTPARMSLEALTIAARHIPLDGESMTGISPVTPYLDLMRTLGEAVDSNKESPYEPAQQLHSNMKKYHASFLCTNYRGYETPGTDEPRRLLFSRDSKGVAREQK